MADSVGLQVRPVDAFSKMSQLLQIRQQQQAIRAQTAEAQMQEQNARQRAALASYDWNRHVGADGTIDIESLNDPQLRAAAGDSYLDVLGRAIEQKEKQVQNKRTMLGLREDQVKAFGEVLGPLISDKDVAEDPQKGIQKVNRALAQYADLYGDDVLPVVAAYAPTLQNLPKGKLPDALRMIQMQSMDVAQQKAAQTPQYVGRGGSMLDVNPMTGAGVPGEVSMTLAPGAQIVTDAKGAQFVLNPQTNQITPVGGGRGGGGPSRAPALSDSPSARFDQPDYQGQAKDVERFQSEVDAARKATDMAAQQKYTNSEILRLSRTTETGPGTAAWRDSKIGGLAGDDYQQLGKMLEKSAIANMVAMGGPPSDARLESAAAANGSTKFNPGALQAVTKFNDATLSGLEQYRRGMDLAVGTKSPKYTNLPEFKSAWSKNFDMDIFRYENAVRDGDQEEISKIRAELAGNKARQKELQEKSRNIHKLVTTGRL